MKLSSLQKLFIGSLIILTSIAITVSCKKLDTGNHTDWKERIVKKFFNHKANVDPIVEAIIQSIKRQNEKRDFIVRLTNTAGYALWDKVIVSTYNDKTQVFIPFVLENGIQTKALLIVKLSGSDTLYHLMYGTNYKKYGFDKNANGLWTAREVFSAFVIFDHKIFGYDKFSVKDDRLLGAEKNDINNEPIIATIIDSVMEQARTQSRCFAHTVTYVMCGTCGSNRTTSLAGPCCNATYFNDVVMFCFDDYEGGGGEWTWYTPEGSGGGGQACPGCSWGDTNPCEEQDPNQPQVPCDQDWLPIVNFNIGDYYADLGYKHFETWYVSPEDEAEIENWRNNNIDTIGLDSCVRRILDKMLNSNNFIGKLLAKMERSNEFPLNIEKFRVNIRVDALTGAWGLTQPGHFDPVTQVFTDTIILNDSLVMFGTELGVASTIVHELIHAYMKSIFYRFFYNSYPVIPTGMNFDSTFNVYMDTLIARHISHSLGSFRSTNRQYDHNFMTNKIFDRMKEMLAYIDDNRNPDEFYWSLMWSGLDSTTTMLKYWPNNPIWPPTTGAPAPSNDSTWGLSYALTEARLDSLRRWISREKRGQTTAKGRPKISGGCY